MTATDRDDARARLARLLRERAAATGYVLSYPQRRLWFLDQLQPDSPVYTVPLGYRIVGPLDVAALERAINQVVRRHEGLRTTYHTVDGEPRQLVRPFAPAPLPVTDLRGHPDPGAEADRLADAEARRPFDLTTGPVLRPTLVRVAADEHRLLLTVHHIACDAWTVGVLGREIGEWYAGRTPPEPPLQYADFAEWQVAHLRGPHFEELLAYWRDRLAGRPAASGIPTDLPRPAVQSFRGAHLTFTLPPAPVAALEALARREGATLYVALLAVFALLLDRHTGDGEVLIGTPVANRDRAELAALVGFFANTLALRLPVPATATYPELLRLVRDEVHAGIAHQDLPFERLVEELHPERDLAHHPLFGVLFSYREDEPDALALTGCDVVPAPGDTGTAKFDLTVSVTRTGGAVHVRLEYNTELYRPATAARLAERLVTAVHAVAAAPDRPVGDQPVLGADERRMLLAEWNATDTPYDPRTLPHRQFAERAALTPDAVAVICRDRSLTYSQLDRAASRLAARLRAAGVRPDTPVGVYLDRTPELLVALLGVWRAGGAYLPLDPDYPARRLAFMVTDAAALVVTSRALAAAAGELGAPTLTVDDDEPAPPAGATAAEPRPDHLAYVIYTSGSTGRPKGVMVTHRNLANFGAGADRLLPADGTPATWLAVTSFSFDISVLELLWTLTRGHTVVLRGRSPAPAPVAGGRTADVDFSLFYFGNARDDRPGEQYRLLLDGARFADRHGFAAVWTPERHFHPFGGMFPNPSVTGAAVAAVTSRVAVRAGSVVLPLQDPLRVAEEWSVVDNISGGRAGVSFASGWHANDFALAPGRYADRKQIMVDGIAEVRRLWRGETVRRRGGTGKEVDLAAYPRPVQQELPVWVTSARHPDTFRLAGEIGAGLLTHLLGHTAEQLAEKIALYRRAWRDHGHGPGDGHVTLMLHTYVGADPDLVRETVREPLCDYLRTSFDLLAGLAGAVGRDVDLRSVPPAELDDLVRLAFDRFYATAGLLGTPEECAHTVRRLAGIGVDEIACLVDFGVPADAALAALPLLARVREQVTSAHRAAAADQPATTEMRRRGVTHLQCTPSLAGVLVAEPDARAALGGLSTMLVGGEPLPPDLARRLAGLVGGPVHNMYGPTEATIWATSRRVTADGEVTIGHPMGNVRAYVVDRSLRPAPVGVPGELLLGGPGVVRGYLGRPGLTAERFVPDPFGSGGRLYRTGDLARWRSDGELEFLGRLDDQVKLHGHRIEPGEIETVLAGHPGIRAAVAAVRGAGATARIIGYCVAGTRPPAAELRAWCGRTLPEYMIPAAFVFLDAFPLTPNGKVDRRRLPEPDRVDPADRPIFKPPETTLEQSIAAAWAEVLRVGRVGRDDNFFDLGGNSLLLLGVRARLLERLDRAPSLVDLFRYPTVSALAAALAAGDDPHSGAPDPRAAAASQAERRRAGLARAGQARRRAGNG